MSLSAVLSLSPSPPLSICHYPQPSQSVSQSRSLYLHLSVSLSLSLSISFSICLSSHSPSPSPLPLSLSLTIFLPLSLFLSLYLSLPLPLHFSLPLPLTLSLSIPLSPSLSLSPSPLSLSPSLSLSLPLPLPFSLSFPLSFSPFPSLSLSLSLSPSLSLSLPSLFSISRIQCKLDYFLYFILRSHTFVDADNVVKMSGLTLDGAVLEVVPIQRWDGRSIEVHGLHRSTSCDTIQLFFESKRRSGGDAVEHMRLDGDDSVAYVTFESSEGQSSALVCSSQDGRLMHHIGHCFLGIAVDKLTLLLILKRFR